jgi:ribosomal protein L7Ae-like RNA K-turn-binding protein
VTERQLQLLGLGVRAGSVAIGSAGVRAGLQSDEVRLVIVAADQSPRTDDKVGRLARQRGVTILEGPTAEELGRRCGRSPVQGVGVCDRQLAAGIVGTDGMDTRRT